MIEKKLKPLSNVIKIDFTGKSKKAKYELTFKEKWQWTSVSKIDCVYKSTFGLGFTGNVWVEVLMKLNYCEDSNDFATCIPTFPDKPEMLGKVLVFVALHEIGHLFGLMNKKSYTGADDWGHTGDTTNCMFDGPNHKDFVEHGKTDKRTKKYVLKEGESLAKLARKVGYPSEIYIKKLRGKDKRSNEEILKKGEKEIWIPDIQKKIKYQREVEFEDKSFTNEQIEFMRKWIKKGNVIFGPI